MAWVRDVDSLYNLIGYAVLRAPRSFPKFQEEPTNSTPVTMSNSGLKDSMKAATGRRLLCGLLVFAPLTFAAAAPKGAPPPKDFTVAQDWSCVLPVKVVVQRDRKLHVSRSRKSSVVATTRQGQTAIVLEAVGVLKRPGLAVVTGALESHLPQLQKGTEVYVMQEWDLFFHAWYDGREVPGGLPILDGSVFRIKREPVVEHWLKVRVAAPRPITAWALDKDYAFDDPAALGKCKHPFDQSR